MPVSAWKTADFPTFGLPTRTTLVACWGRSTLGLGPWQCAWAIALSLHQLDGDAVREAASQRHLLLSLAHDHGTAGEHGLTSRPAALGNAEPDGSQPGAGVINAANEERLSRLRLIQRHVYPSANENRYRLSTLSQVCT